MDTTRLDELPVHNNSSASSLGQPSGNNIVIQQYDPNMMNMAAGPHSHQQQQQQAGMDQRTLQELVSGVQRASGAGMTALPARDIPRDSLAMQQDEQVKPNYVPRHPDNVGGNSGSAAESEDYIKRYESTDDVQRNNRRTQNRADTLETLYTEFQMPILIGVLYFIFQMPALRTGIMQFLPSLFNKDGNMNLTGLVATSVGYATAYYIVTKVIAATV